MNSNSATTSIIIPAKEEPFLNETILDLTRNASGKVEIIVVLDGYWPDKTIDGVKYIHFGNPVGMRRAINSAAAISTGQYLMKIDAHCAISKGFDERLKDGCTGVFVPVRYELDVKKWQRKKHKKYEFEYIEKGTYKGRKWPEYAEKVEGEKTPKLMTMQGSCWFMEKKFFDKIGGLDDVNFGTMGREAQEVSIKTWLSGGELRLNRNAWYAHWNKPKESVIAGMKSEKLKSVEQITKIDIKPIIEIFKPVPGWN